VIDFVAPQVGLEPTTLRLTEVGKSIVRKSGGAFVPVSYLRNGIEDNRLLGPKIMARYEVMSPKGGMWDVGGMRNTLALAYKRRPPGAAGEAVEV